jgi:hypothetical protein
MIKYYKQKGGRIYRKVEVETANSNPNSKKKYFLLEQVMSSTDDVFNSINTPNEKQDLFDIDVEYIEVDEKEYTSFHENVTALTEPK